MKTVNKTSDKPKRREGEDFSDFCKRVEEWNKQQTEKMAKQRKKDNNKVLKSLRIK